MNPQAANEIAARLSKSAADLGLSGIGFAPALPPPRVEHLRRWLAAGYAGTMTFMQRSAHRRTDPQRVLPDAQTVICAAENYSPGHLPAHLRNDPARGIIAAYAGGSDYHEIMLAKLEQLAKLMTELAPEHTHRCYVDTGALLERDFGERAGLGFVGKNTLLIHPRCGSQFFLGEIITTLKLPVSPVPSLPSCGSCTRCLAMCPTRAFPTAYVLDSRPCISYLTIEFKGIIPRELRGKMGNHIFGCDDCQDCCPWNDRFAQTTKEAAYLSAAERRAPFLVELAGLSEIQYRERFAGSPVLRPGYAGFLRNVAVALGNWGEIQALDGLRTLLEHESAVVRAHAVWAVARIGDDGSRSLLRAAARREANPVVLAELADTNVA